MHKPHKHHKHPGFLLKRVTRMHHNIVAARFKQAGISSRSQSLILMFLTHGSASLPSQKVISESTGITPAGVTSALRHLELEGLIVKQPSAEDNRRKKITVTEKGKEHLERCRSAIVEVNKGLFEGFLPQEIQNLEQYFIRMCQNLEKMGAVAPDEMRWRD
jgi:DNA-binding MarR family transcriptional regulator